MTTVPVQFTTLNNGHYQVSDRTTGDVLGAVGKYRHRSLSHPTVTIWWEAAINGRKIKDGGGQVPMRYSTRTAAVDALVTRRASAHTATQPD